MALEMKVYKEIAAYEPKPMFGRTWRQIAALAYLDKDGDYWLLDRSGNWYDWSLLDEPDVRGGRAEHYAPFTRLVPMPTEDAVHAAVYNALRGSAVDGMYPLRTINAVMALLGGGDDE